MQNKKEKQPAWYEEWFGKEYLEVYAHRNHQEAVSDINCVEKLLKLDKAGSILDLACGSGRHSLELARRGYNVTGVDLSHTLLEVARNSAAKQGLTIPFYQADMRTPPLEKPFNFLINMFTSFGYFENDRENSRIFAAFYKSLVAGGKFLMDYINKDHVLDSLVPEDCKTQGDRTLLQQRSYNEKTRRLEKIITITHNNEERKFLESVRLYTLDEMVTMAKANGLKIEKHFGSLQADPFSPQAPRLVLVGSKP